MRSCRGIIRHGRLLFALNNCRCKYLFVTTLATHTHLLPASANPTGKMKQAARAHRFRPTSSSFYFQSPSLRMFVWIQVCRTASLGHKWEHYWRHSMFSSCSSSTSAVSACRTVFFIPTGILQMKSFRSSLKVMQRGDVRLVFVFSGPEDGFLSNLFQLHVRAYSSLSEFTA